MLFSLFFLFFEKKMIPGMLAEDTSNGGWGAGPTLGFAIVSDAFSSIRHDRHYTTEFTPDNYTTWGEGMHIYFFVYIYIYFNK